MQTTDDTKVINTRPTFNPGYVALDVEERNTRALNQFPTFFNNPAHQQKIQAVQAIVDQFFAERAGVYVNHRTGRDRPFTVVKVERPRFPNNLSKAARDAGFHTPLKSLGVEVKFAAGTNSYLIHIK
jgi:hypothetical protein